MPFILRPGRNATLKLAFELLRAQERKDKRAAKAEQAPPPVKEPAAKRNPRVKAKRPR
jgi:hypothetical protein